MDAPDLQVACRPSPTHDGDVAFVHRVGYPDENLSHFESGDIHAYGVRGGTTSFRWPSASCVARRPPGRPGP